MKYPIKSVLEEISTAVFSMRNLNEAKDYIINFINEKRINDKDKESIINATRDAKSLTSLQTYLCNALLKYEGLGVGSKPTSTPVTEEPNS
jgi:hypothetical protein